MESRGAPAGITVIDLSRLLPGPYCATVLADHGARVINIENPRYRAERLMVTTISRNKKHMALDLKHPEGRRIFFGPVARADVVLEGFRPGVSFDADTRVDGTKSYGLRKRNEVHGEIANARLNGTMSVAAAQRLREYRTAIPSGGTRRLQLSASAHGQPRASAEPRSPEIQ
ncbi:MAG: CoA transferase [Desulfosarcina sp.]|nr:CoA transferase [Desulfobacterales bacterium]